MNKAYVRECIFNYHENVARLREIKVEMNDVGSMNQNLSPEPSGHSEFNAFEKRMIKNERLEKERERLSEKIRLVDSVAKLNPIVHAITKGNVPSITRYAEIHKMTRYKARRQFDDAISRYAEKKNCK